MSLGQSLSKRVDRLRRDELGGQMHRRLNALDHARHPKTLKLHLRGKRERCIGPLQVERPLERPGKLRERRLPTV